MWRTMGLGWERVFGLGGNECLAAGGETVTATGYHKLWFFLPWRLLTAMSSSYGLDGQNERPDSDSPMHASDLSVSRWDAGDEFLHTS